MRKARSISLALALLVVAPVAVLRESPVARAAPVDHVLVAEVYDDTYVSGEPDEFVRLANPTDATVDLSGWKLTDGEGTLTFPAGAALAPGAEAYVTGKASAFRLDMVVTPQFEYLADTDPSVPQMTKSGSFVLANAGDEVMLKKADGSLVDVVVYGASGYTGAGWTGAPVPKVSEGFVLHRHADETTGAFGDTDSATDWKDARLYRAGQSHFAPATSAFNGTVTAFASPDGSYGVVTDALNATTSSIDLNIYELTNVHLGDVLADRAAAGVSVRVLLEGGPAGMNQSNRYQENWILARIAAAGGEVKFMVTNATQGIHARYDFDHAKYAVLDGSRALVLSGNFKYTGVPVDPTAGNREWGILVDDASVAQYLENVFAGDFDPAHRDLLAFGSGTDWRYLPPPANFTPDATVPKGAYEHPYPPRTVTGDVVVRPILVPDTDLRESDGLLSALSNATGTVLVEQMYAHEHWGTQNDTPATAPNRFLEAALDAARHHGAYVFVLLGDEYIDRSDSRNNFATRDYVNSLRTSEGLHTYARIVNSSIAHLTKIHNKGAVIDGKTALVSSINWGEASATLNREVALLVDDRDVAQFFSDVFWYDWSPRQRTAPADLVVTNVTFEPSALPFGIPSPLAGHVRATIENHGPFAAGAFNVSLNGTPSWLGPRAVFAEKTVSGLAPGASVVLEFPVDTTLRVGRWNFTAMADPENRVLELDETNNEGSAVFALDADVPGVDARGFAGSPSVPALPPT